MNADEYAEVAAGQKAAALSVADKIKAGGALTPHERVLAAALIRRAADAIAPERPRARGRQRKLPDNVHLEYAMLRVHQGQSRFAAWADIAGRYFVDESTVRQMLGHKRSKSDPAMTERRRLLTANALRTLRYL